VQYRGQSSGGMSRVFKFIYVRREQMMEINERIIDFICREILSNDKDRLPGPDDPLIGPESVIDSFALTQLIVFIDEDLGIKVDDVDIVPENFETLAALFSFVDGKLGGQAGLTETPTSGRQSDGVT
jgi:acyl carrier protein